MRRPGSSAYFNTQRRQLWASDQPRRDKTDVDLSATLAARAQSDARTVNAAEPGFAITNSSSGEELARYESASAAAAALRELIVDGSEVRDLEIVATAKDGCEMPDVSGAGLLDAVTLYRLIDSAQD